MDKAKPDVRLIFLPKPRRSRQPYQWSCMAGLLIYATANLIVGPAANSPLLLVPGHSNSYLNWCLLLGAAGCLISMVIPDNLWRLFTELSGHVLLIFTTAMFVVVAWKGFDNAKQADGSPGLSLNLIMSMCITVAAIGRTYEIAKTVRRTWFKSNKAGAIVETDGGSALDQAR